MKVDGAPRIFCFQASCAPAVTEANRRLPRELGSSPCKLRLPDGRMLRSGDLLQKNGEVVPREVIESGRLGEASLPGSPWRWRCVGKEFGSNRHERVCRSVANENIRVRERLLNAWCLRMGIGTAYCQGRQSGALMISRWSAMQVIHERRNGTLRVSAQQCQAPRCPAGDGWVRVMQALEQSRKSRSSIRGKCGDVTDQPREIGSVWVAVGEVRGQCWHSLAGTYSGECVGGTCRNVGLSLIASQLAEPRNNGVSIVTKDAKGTGRIFGPFEERIVIGPIQEGVRDKLVGHPPDYEARNGSRRGLLWPALDPGHEPRQGVGTNPADSGWGGWVFSCILPKLDHPIGQRPPTIVWLIGPRENARERKEHPDDRKGNNEPSALLHGLSVPPRAEVSNTILCREPAN